MIKVAFCDDEPVILEQITALLEKYKEQRCRDMEYAAFRSPLELLVEMENGLHPDVLLLDVIMPGESGISAAREIRQFDNDVKIIFLTSSAEFAVQSYTVGAYYYQLKPIREETFFQLMDSVIDECRRTEAQSILLRCKSGISRIRLDKLEYCEIIGRALLFHMANGQVLESAGSLDKLTADLESYGNFLRPHRSFLVNMDYIQSIFLPGLADGVPYGDTHTPREVFRDQGAVFGVRVQPKAGVLMMNGTTALTHEALWNAIYLLNDAVVGIFGMILSAAFCDITWTKKRLLHYWGCMAVILLVQAAVYCVADVALLRASIRW